MKIKKNYVISARIPDILGKKFDEISEQLHLNKTDFITECVNKLIEHNEFYLENYQNKDKLIEKIRKKIKWTLKTNIKIINGNIEDINEIAIITFCDFLFASSEDFWKSTKEIYKEFEFEENELDNKLFERFSGEFLLNIEDISLMTLPQSKQVFAEELVNDTLWTSSVETKKLLLLIAANEFLKDYSLKEVITEIIDFENDRKGEKHVLIIDAEGRYRRGKDSLYSPIYVEKIDIWREKFDK